MHQNGCYALPGRATGSDDAVRLPAIAGKPQPVRRNDRRIETGTAERGKGLALVAGAKVVMVVSNLSLCGAWGNVKGLGGLDGTSARHGHFIGAWLYPFRSGRPNEFQNGRCPSP